MASWLINSLCAHMFEKSTDEGWNSLSRTSPDGQCGSLEQIAWILATQKQEKLSINN